MEGRKRKDKSPGLEAMICAHDHSSKATGEQRMSGRKAALENRHTIRLDDETNKSLIAKAGEKNLLNISETFLLNISERLPDGWIEKI